MQEVLPLKMSTVLEPSLLSNHGLGNEVQFSDLGMSDIFFDTFVKR